jgi:hypothetical protein
MTGIHPIHGWKLAHGNLLPSNEAWCSLFSTAYDQHRLLFPLEHTGCLPWAAMSCHRFDSDPFGGNQIRIWDRGFRRRAVGVHGSSSLYKGESYNFPLSARVLGKECTIPHHLFFLRGDFPQPHSVERGPLPHHL